MSFKASELTVKQAVELMPVAYKITGCKYGISKYCRMLYIGTWYERINNKECIAYFYDYETSHYCKVTKTKLIPKIGIDVHYLDINGVEKKRNVNGGMKIGIIWQLYPLISLLARLGFIVDDRKENWNG